MTKKIGGPDDGQLYILKASNISKIIEREHSCRERNRTIQTDMLTNEREVIYCFLFNEIIENFSYLINSNLMDGNTFISIISIFIRCSQQ